MSNNIAEAISNKQAEITAQGQTIDSIITALNGKTGNNIRRYSTVLNVSSTAAQWITVLTEEQIADVRQYMSLPTFIVVMIRNNVKMDTYDEHNFFIQTNFIFSDIDNYYGVTIRRGSTIGSQYSKNPLWETRGTTVSGNFNIRVEKDHVGEGLRMYGSLAKYPQTFDVIMFW